MIKLLIKLFTHSRKSGNLHARRHKNDPNVVIFKGIPNFEGFTDKKPRLLIIDDQANSCNGSISQLFTRGSHHYNISVIVLAQNVFTANPHFRTMSLNSHYIVAFKNPRGKDQMSVLARQICLTDYKFFLESFEDSCHEPHTYFLLDMTQSYRDFQFGQLSWRV